MKYEWLLFDLDDTLLNFSVSEHFALTQALAKVGIDFQATHLEIYERINRKCWDDFEAGILPQSAINHTRFSRFLIAMNLQKENPTEFGNYYLEQLSEKAVYMKGADTLLEEQYGKYKLGIVTNGLKQVQRPKLRKNNLAHYFNIIVVSDEIGVSKPNTSFFDHAFREMNFPDKEKVLIIGDSLNSDIRGGHNYGIDTCWYNFKKKQNTINLKPTFEIDDLNQLKSLNII